MTSHHHHHTSPYNNIPNQRHLVDGDKKLKLHCELMMDALKQPHGTHRAQPAQRAASLHNTPSADGGGSGGGGGLNKAKKQAKEPPLSLLLLRKYASLVMIQPNSSLASPFNRRLTTMWWCRSLPVAEGPVPRPPVFISLSPPRARALSLSLSLVGSTRYCLASAIEC